MPTPLFENRTHFNTTAAGLPSGRNRSVSSGKFQDNRKEAITQGKIRSAVEEFSRGQMFRTPSILEARPRSEQTPVQFKIRKKEVVYWEKRGERLSRKGNWEISYLANNLRQLLRHLRDSNYEKAGENCNVALNRIGSLLENPGFKKYHKKLEALKQGLQEYEPLPKEKLRLVVEKLTGSGVIFTEKEGDFNPEHPQAEDLLNMRKNMLVNRLYKERYNTIALQDIEAVERLAAKGVDKGKGKGKGTSQWIGGAMCDMATEAIAGRPRYIAHRTGGTKEGTSIDMDHHYRMVGNDVIDPTWKQFFKRKDTEGLPPIFKGGTPELLSMGLPEKEAWNYLNFIGAKDMNAGLENVDYISLSGGQYCFDDPEFQQYVEENL